MGVVVRRYIDILIIIITFPYSTCISSFLAAASLRLLLCSFKNVLSLINYIDKNVERTLTVRACESRDFHMRGTV